jgi:hypothetical protein
MSALDPREAERFGKILGLLGSDHHGERAAAALKATEFLQARELSWSEVSEMLKHPRSNTLPPPAAQTRQHQVAARQCLASNAAWKDHERAFLLTMAMQRRSPTERQRDWLDGLLDRSKAGSAQ